jgi:uncharacterized phage protein (TIGR02218 family)
MKPVSPALKAYLAAQIASPSPSFAFAECFTITLANGQTLYSTSADAPITYNGNTFVANGLIVQGLKYRASVGLDIDQQDIKLAAPSGWTLDGAPLMFAILNGAFDNATIQRDRAFFSDYVGGTLVGGVTMFKGRFLGINAGAIVADATVANDLVLLNQNMPRNVFIANCYHTLYDSGCTLNKASYATSGVVGVGSTPSIIVSSAAALKHIKGTIVFTSGVNDGLAAGVKDIQAGLTIVLSFPLIDPPAAGDTFTIYQGCDHTWTTCKATFNNLANFGGCPFIPPPQTAL